ncbi:10011_t:CDS:2 [Entrophospora sp. SA101]|nr:10011_t:CDS:2 [Entrophospora sp. SA101]
MPSNRNSDDTPSASISNAPSYVTTPKSTSSSQSSISPISSSATKKNENSDNNDNNDNNEKINRYNESIQGFNNFVKNLQEYNDKDFKTKFDLLERTLSRIKQNNSDIPDFFRPLYDSSEGCFLNPGVPTNFRIFVTRLEQIDPCDYY